MDFNELSVSPERLKGLGVLFGAAAVGPQQLCHSALKQPNLLLFTAECVRACVRVYTQKDKRALIPGEKIE